MSLKCECECEMLFESDKPVCKSMSQKNNGYCCSRLEGHIGPHVACATTHKIKTWEDAECAN